MVVAMSHVIRTSTRSTLIWGMVEHEAVLSGVSLTLKFVSLKSLRTHVGCAPLVHWARMLALVPKV